MARTIVLASCQPPWPGPERGPDEVLSAAFELLAQAADRGAEVICLPEYLNVAGMKWEEVLSRCDARAERTLRTVEELCARRDVWVVVPVLAHVEGRPRNRAVLMGPDGPVGYYDKVHLTPSERERWGISAGGEYPVFELPWGKAGLMTCYDVFFPEVARILAIGGAEVILFPALQRSLPEHQLELQVRARAFDNGVWVVRSSYGTPRDEPWKPGMPAGKSCIGAPDGTLAADAGRFAGIALAEAPLDRPELGPLTHTGPVVPLARTRLTHRRPETYTALCRPASRRAGPGADGDQ